MRVEIDEHSGFCFGVVNAIRKAEQELERGMLYCIGDIVHNDLEVERLRLRGLKTIEHEQFARLQHCRVLFRAHGEPPVSYEIAQKNEVEVIDASCPVVLNLQKRIRKAYEQTREQGGQVVIYGKRGHAEVVGLVGQTNGEALVIENPEDIRQIDFSRPVILFSQTTKSLEGFQAIAALLKEKGGAQVVVNDTICRKVANRIPQLREFAQKHDVVIFVSGEKSSNGKQLFATCCEVNPRTYLVQRAEDVKPEMLENAQSVGISGATSTPAWVMEEIRHKIELQHDLIMGRIKRIGVLTSGGDAPGMNAAIRAVVRTAIFNGCEAYGIFGGYQGLIEGDIKRLKSNDVSNIIQRGGTILKSARSMEFRTPEGRTKAAQMLAEHKIDALVVIGGDGSFTGAKLLIQEDDIPVVGIPGTIDNDLYGTDSTIGYDTALNTIMEAVDKIRDTASSHERLFFIEVMGREAGFLALNGAIASGAEAAIIPEIATEVDQLSELIGNGFRKSKNSSIVLVAESELTGGATGLAERVKNEFPQYDVRVTILGHIQRGGSPSASDRILASRMGEASINALLEGQRNVMIGIQNDELVYIPFSKAIKNQKPINRDLLNTIKILSI